MPKRIICIIVLFISLLSSSGCENDGYRLYKDSGNYYISLPEEYSASSDSAFCQAPPSVSFASYDEMLSDIRTGNFTHKELMEIARFTKNTDGNIIVCNLDHLFEPTYPSNCLGYTIEWHGSFCEYEIEIEGGGRCYFSDHYTQKFVDEEIAGLTSNTFTPVSPYSGEVLSTESDDENNATVYYYTFGEDKSQIRMVRIYIVEESDATYGVLEQYSSCSPDSVPDYVEIICDLEDNNFVLFIYSPGKRYSVDEIKEFALVPYRK